MSGTTKQDIFSKIADGSYVLLEKTGSNSSSWKNFKIVVEKDSNAPVGYVQCQKEGCGTLLAYRGSTTAMIRHKCKEHRRSLGALSTAEQGAVRDKCVWMCASDLIPFSILSGESFISLCQELINTGAKYGSVNAQDVLPPPRIVSRHIKDMANEIKDELIRKVKEAIQKNQCAMMCDLWTDKYRKTHYLTVASSFIDNSNEKWELRNYVLNTTRFPQGTKTGEHCLEEMYEQLAALQITVPELEKVTFVSDQGPDIKEALTKHKHMPCVMHCIETAIKHILDETFLCDELPDVHESIQVTRNVIGFIKRSGLVEKLEKTLIVDIETRWNGIYTMLDLFNSQKEQIEDVLKEANQLEMMTSYNSDIVKTVIDFLEPFKEATDDLEGGSEPTLPFVVPWIFKLLDLCEIEDKEVTLTKLKERAQKFLKDEVLNNVLDIHYVATFLHPNFKKLLPLGEAKREAIQETVRQMLTEIKVVNVKEELMTCPVMKFQNWPSSASHKKDEVEKYVYMDVRIDECKNLLAWWGTNAGSLPKLSKLAGEVLCVPASSAAEAWNFSRVGVASQKRTYVDLNHVNDILLIHNNKKFCNNQL